MRLVKRVLGLLCVMLLAGCVTVPSGPSVRVFPSPGKPYDMFLSEDSTCRRAAEREIGISPQEVADQNAATGAITGAAIGTGLGAAMGAASGHAGTGAIIGAVGGLLVGTAAGSDAGRIEGREAQRRYDTVYLQCMYSYGNQVRTPAPRYYRKRAIAPPPGSYDYVPPDYYRAYPYPPPDTPPPGPYAP